MPRSFLVLLSFRQFSLLVSAIGQPDAERRHVVIAKLAGIVLVVVLDIEVWTEIPVRQLHLCFPLPNGGSLGAHIRILLTSFLQEFGCGVRKSSQRESLGNDVRGLLRASQDLLDLGFKQSFFLMVVCDLLKNLRVLQLSFQHILLIALAHTIACLGRLLYLIQYRVTSLENPEGLLNVCQ